MPDPRMAAGLTLYRPDWSILQALLDRLRAEAERVYVVVDGPVGEAIEAGRLGDLEALPRVTVLALRTNAGIAAGLNRLVAAASGDGFERLALFDQDSEAGAGLLSRLNGAFSQLRDRGLEPAAVGPRPVAAPGSDTSAPRYRLRGERVGELLATDFLIVSGSVLDLSGFQAVGRFDESLRMDGVDVEWGFRAWSRGRSIWVDEGAIMPHRVGTGIVRFGPVVFPRQSVARMGNYVRSQIALLSMKHVPFRWKLRSLLYVPLQVLVFAAQGGRPLRVLRDLFDAVSMPRTPGPPQEPRP